MKPKIRMVGLDLDGTVFNNNKEISTHTRSVLKEAIRQGCIVLPATGRPEIGLPGAFLEIPGVEYALTSNGARIIRIPSGETMRNVLNDLANYADVVLPGIGECEILAGTTDKEKAADFYHQKGAALVVIKDGKNGAYVSEKKENGEVVRDMIPGYPVKKVVDTVGAGDGFAVGVLSGLLKGLPVTECAKRGNAIGSIQVQHRGDNEGLPTEEILQSYMAGNIQK